MGRFFPTAFCIFLWRLRYLFNFRLHFRIGISLNWSRWVRHRCSVGHEANQLLKLSSDTFPGFRKDKFTKIFHISSPSDLPLYPELWCFLFLPWRNLLMSTLVVHTWLVMVISFAHIAYHRPVWRDYLVSEYPLLVSFGVSRKIIYSIKTKIFYLNSLWDFFSFQIMLFPQCFYSPPRWSLLTSAFVVHTWKLMTISPVYIAQDHLSKKFPGFRIFACNIECSCSDRTTPLGSSESTVCTYYQSP